MLTAFYREERRGNVGQTCQQMEQLLGLPHESVSATIANLNGSDEHTKTLRRAIRRLNLEYKRRRKTHLVGAKALGVEIVKLIDAYKAILAINLPPSGTLYLIDTGQRLSTKAGNEAIVWGLTPAGRQMAAREIDNVTRR